MTSYNITNAENSYSNDKPQFSSSTIVAADAPHFTRADPGNYLIDSRYNNDATAAGQTVGANVRMVGDNANDARNFARELPNSYANKKILGSAVSGRR